MGRPHHVKMMVMETVVVQPNSHEFAGYHTVPMARPGILTAAIFCFIITWNEFLFGYLLSRQKVVPLPVGITGFILERGPVWELIAATGIIITIPMFFFALAIQRHFTKGMNLGAVR